MSNDNEFRNFIINFMVGGVTGTLVKSVTAPFDRIKLILQTQDVASQFNEGKRKRYKGVIDCLLRIPKEQGFASLWRGNVLSIARFFPSQALNFSFNTLYNNKLRTILGSGLLTHLVSGALAGITTVTLLYPLEFCQTRIAADVGSDAKYCVKSADFVEREFRGAFDCISKVTMVEGFHVLYRGYLVALVGVSCYRSFYFGLYGYWKDLCQTRATEIPLSMELIVAQGITIVSGLISYPFDTIGRTMMMDVAKPNSARKFHSLKGVANFVYQQRGFVGFYKGITANYLRGLGGSMILVLYGQTIRYLNTHE